MDNYGNIPLDSQPVASQAVAQHLAINDHGESTRISACGLNPAPETAPRGLEQIAV